MLVCYPLQYCPPKCRIGGQSGVGTMVCPPKCRFRGESGTGTLVCPPKCRIGGQKCVEHRWVIGGTSKVCEPLGLARKPCLEELAGVFASSGDALNVKEN